MEKYEFKGIVTLLNACMNDDQSIYRLSHDQITWAIDEVSAHVAYYKKNKSQTFGTFLCMDCYEEFSANGADIKYTNENSTKLEGTVRCPHCGRVLKIVPSRRRTLTQFNQMAFTTIVNGIRCDRIFEQNAVWNANHADRTTDHRRTEYDHYDFHEVMRVWHNGSDKVLCSCGLKAFPYSSKSPWAVHTAIEVHSASGEYSNRSYAEDDYSHVDVFCPTEYTLSYDVRYKQPIVAAITERLKSRTNSRNVISNVLRYPMIESMVKAGWVREAALIANRRNEHWQNGVRREHTDEVLNAMRICMKNGYHPSDMQMWCDYFEDLRELQLDTHSPHYICPANLREAHTVTTELLAVRRRERNNHYTAVEMAQKEAIYRSEKSIFFGIAFGEDTQHLSFHVIGSVAEMMDEGKHMHHCVGGYWSHPDSLIFSCRDADGKRLATIEVNLANYYIVQTRGVCNAVPEHKELINETIMAHMDEIRMAKSTRRKPDVSIHKLEATLNPTITQQPAAIAV